MSELPAAIACPRCQEKVEPEGTRTWFGYESACPVCGYIFDIGDDGAWADHRENEQRRAAALQGVL